MSCGVGHRLGLDPALLWLRCRPVAKAPTGPLSWEPPYAMGMALKRETKRKKNFFKEHRINTGSLVLGLPFLAL